MHVGNFPLTLHGAMLSPGTMDENKTTTLSVADDRGGGCRTRPSPVWTAYRTRRLISLWNTGLATAEVAAVLETTLRAVECKVHKLRAAGHHVAPRRQSPPARSNKARRKCLYCGGMFASTHIGNRLCPACLEDGPFTGAML